MSIEMHSCKKNVLDTRNRPLIAIAISRKVDVNTLKNSGPPGEKGPKQFIGP